MPKKSTHNRKTLSPAEWLELMNCNPIEGMARIAMNDVPCGVLSTPRGNSVSRLRGQDRLLERVCESCFGSAKEKIPPELRGKMFAELSKYCYPRLKQIEVQAGEGAASKPTLEIVFVNPPQALEEKNSRALPGTIGATATHVPVFRDWNNGGNGNNGSGTPVR